MSVHTGIQVNAQQMPLSGQINASIDHPPNLPQWHHRAIKLNLAAFCFASSRKDLNKGLLPQHLCC